MYMKEQTSIIKRVTPFREHDTRCKDCALLKGSQHFPEGMLASAPQTGLVANRPNKRGQAPAVVEDGTHKTRRNHGRGCAQ